MLPFGDMGERDPSFLLLVFHLSDAGGSPLLCGLAAASNAAAPAIAPLLSFQGCAREHFFMLSCTHALVWNLSEEGA